MAAALEVFRNGAWHELTSLKVYRSGAWRRLKTLKVYSGGAWRSIVNFIQPLTLSVSPSSVSGAGSGTTAQTVYSGSATVTPSGGVGPFTYSWARVSGAAITPLSPSSASSAFYKYLNKFELANATMRCTVTDSQGSTATADVDVTLDNGSV
jgi:hypothetical protein